MTLLRPASMFATLVDPKSIAIVGLSARAGSQGQQVLHAVRTGGYKGQIVGVHPSALEVDGIPVARKTSELPIVPECALICTPAELVPAMVRDALDHGCTQFVVYASGFDETDEGSKLADELRAIHQQRPYVLVGPNGMGFVSFAHSSWFSGYMPPGHLGVGQVAIVSQSGSAGFILPLTCGRLQFSHVFSVGNQTVTDLADYVDFLAEDQNTAYIGLVVESVRRSGAFAAACEKARDAGKVIVALHAGSSDRGAAQARSHTGSIVGSSNAFDAFCRRYGVVRAMDYDEFIESLYLFSRAKAPAQRGGIAFVGLSGGEAALISDVGESRGLQFATFADETVEAVRALLPSFGSIANPLDATGVLVSRPEEFSKLVRHLAEDDDVSSCIVYLDTTPDLTPEGSQIYEALVASLAGIAGATGKMVAVLSNYGGGIGDLLLSTANQSGVPIVQGTRAGLAAIDALVRQSQMGADHAFPPLADRNDTGHACPRDLEELRQGMPGPELVARVTKAFGIMTPAAGVAQSLDEALALGDDFGYPVILKVADKRVVHKAQAGCVSGIVNGADELSVAYHDVYEAARRYLDHEPEGIFVQQFVTTGGFEAFIGVQTDREVGAVITVGFGGALIEVLRIHATEMLPLGPDGVERLLRGSRLDEVFERYAEEGKILDRNGFAATIESIANLYLALDDAAVEVEVNPIIVGSDGDGVCAVDFRVVRVDAN